MGYLRVAPTYAVPSVHAPKKRASREVDTYVTQAEARSRQAAVYTRYNTRYKRAQGQQSIVLLLWSVYGVLCTTCTGLPPPCTYKRVFTLRMAWSRTVSSSLPLPARRLGSATPDASVCRLLSVCPCAQLLAAATHAPAKTLRREDVKTTCLQHHPLTYTGTLPLHVVDLVGRLHISLLYSRYPRPSLPWNRPLILRANLP